MKCRNIMDNMPTRVVQMVKAGAFDSKSDGVKK